MSYSWRLLCTFPQPSEGAQHHIEVCSSIRARRVTLLLQMLKTPPNLAMKSISKHKSKSKVYFSFRKKTGKYKHEYLSYTSDSMLFLFHV